MKRAKTYTIVDNYFKLDMRLKKLEDLMIPNELVNNQGDGSSFLMPLKKCRSSYSKIELVNLFYVLMDEGILYFDSNDAKKTEPVFRNL